MTELFEKSSPDADVSGFGFEVTLRIPREADEERPPSWPIPLLQGVGHYALSGHGSLDTGHLIDLGGSLAPTPEGGAPSLLTGLVAVPDAMFGKVDAPFGSILFLQLYGLTAAELEAMSSWTMERKVGLVQEVDRLALTRLERGPLEQDRRTAAAYRRHALGVLL